MKKILYIIMVLVVVLALFPSNGTAARQDAPFSTDLIAGQNTDVGDVKIWDDGKYLYVQYITVKPWCLKATHLAVASDLLSIPQKNGNPIPGQFPYSNDHGCASTFTYTVPLIQDSCELYIAAHAAINTGETAWGNGSGFPGSNWAMYFLYMPSSCNNAPTPTITSSATSTHTATPITHTTTSTFTPTSTLTATFTSTSTATFTSTTTGTPNTATPTFTATYTPTSTATFTPTTTGTPNTATPTNTPGCQPTVVTADFGKFASGASVEGMGKVVPNLNIDAKGTAVKIATGVAPMLYGAPNENGTINGSLMTNSGFGDYTTKTAKQAHLYTFTFAPGTSVNNFSLRMVDFGDWNPMLNTSHNVKMTAYNAANEIVAIQELKYTTPPEQNPHSSDLYGDLWFSGDAASASSGQPGNWIWNVSGNGIVKIVLSFGAGFDPNIALDLLTFAVECPVCGSTQTADFGKFASGESVEGMGKVAPNLSIDAKGTAVKIATGVAPMLYGAPNENGTINGSLMTNSGFGDYTTKTAKQAHLYTFTFAPGTSVNNFSLRMVDFGDWNPMLNTSHNVKMTAYNAANEIVAMQELKYTTPPEQNPHSSDLYGDLWFSGDAASASSGQPGNWIWNVSGNGIVKIVLSFGAGFDPNIALDLLRITYQCP